MDGPDKEKAGLSITRVSRGKGRERIAKRGREKSPENTKKRRVNMGTGQDDLKRVLQIKKVGKC